jgi:hypothetical protein
VLAFAEYQTKSFQEEINLSLEAIRWAPSGNFFSFGTKKVWDSDEEGYKSTTLDLKRMKPTDTSKGKS